MVVMVKFSRVPLRLFSRSVVEGKTKQCNSINGHNYICDDYTNVTPKILSYIGQNLHNEEFNPLCLIKKRMVEHFYTKYVSRTGTPLFSIYDNLHPIVSTDQNFDSLLIPEDHVSRKKSDCYYFNRDYLLRGHTTAHQSELIKMGLDNFLIVGDVYRRDEIDSTHYPVFHQVDGVRLFSKHQLSDFAKSDVEIFDHKDGKETEGKQRFHTLDSSQIVEHQLKSTLLALATALFGPDIKTRWVDAFFPFTHPSWELEVFHRNDWMEVLGCGIIQHKILSKAGAEDRIGWAFGLGLERLAMMLYSIPDIRLFWSKDTGFKSQFTGKTPSQDITYKPVSIFPQCKNDMSFWLPEDRKFEQNDYYEIVREVGGDIIEQIFLKDEFVHPKTKRASKCYGLIYRHLERTLTQEEVNLVHEKICDRVSHQLGVTIR